MDNIFICLDNIRSLYNVGAVFRTTEFFGLKNIILLGYSGIIVKDGKKKLHPKVSKTALGTENSLNVIYMEDSEELVNFANKNNLKIIAIEQNTQSIEFEKWIPSDHAILVFGNEKTGVNNSILDKSSEIIEIHRSGKHQSLNIEVTAGIILSKVRKAINPN
jgi:tRNA G18 (ribose-2'-O)-methylase SpoU